MSFTRPHPEYLRHEARWRRTKAVLDGRDAVLELAEEVLPKTEADRRNPDMYNNYCKRASWFGGTSKTLDAWVGTVFRKPVTVDVPSPYQWRLNNIDDQWSTIDSFARRAFREVAAYGRFGVLVDSGIDRGFPAEHGLPFLVGYSADQITSWTPRVTSKGVSLSQVILFEMVEEPHESGFGVKHVPTYRVLDLDSLGYYRCRRFSLLDGRIAEHPTIYPTKGNERLDHIPFYIVGPNGMGHAVQKAPLLDVVEENIAHFQSSAELASSLYWSASPVALITGLPPDDKDKYPVGRGVLWKLPAGATAGYLEFSGPGVAAILEDIREHQQRMMLLGSAVLSVPRRQVETAEALSIRASGESASLLTMVDSVSQVLTTAVTEACWWGSIVGTVKVSLNRDLVSTRLSDSDIKVLIYAYQAGIVTLEVVLYNLSQGEILIPGMSIEDLKAQLLTQAPILSIGSGAATAGRAMSPEGRRSVSQMPNDSAQPVTPKMNGDAR